MTNSDAVPRIALNDGVRVPQLGFGTWRVELEDTARVVGDALAAGYRHIDTAQMYHNERGVGDAFRASGLQREEVFITTKCDNTEHGREAALQALERSLELLRLDDVDLYLIHWPMPRQDLYVETWRGLIDARERGLTRSVGVSNFQIPHVERVIAETGVVPSVNQIELHPRFTQEPVVAELRRLGVAIQAWRPLIEGQILTDPTIVGIASSHGKSAAQTVIRWHLQLGYVVFPKSVRVSRMRENLDVFDFELSGEQVAAISALNQDLRTSWDPDTTG